MKLYCTACLPPYDNDVRLYASLPEWDGFDYRIRLGQYHRVRRSFLELLGVRELPAPRSRAVLEIDLHAQPLYWTVDGDTIAKMIK